MAGLAELNLEYQRLVAERDALGARYEAGEKNLLPQIQQLNAQIRAVLIQIDNLQGPVDSSGQIVNDDAGAKVPNANSQNPGTPVQQVDANGRIVNPSDTTAGTNAVAPVGTTNTDTGTDAPVRKNSQTQSTSDLPGPGPIRAPGGGGIAGVVTRPSAATSPGAAAGSDDSGTKNATRAQIDNLFSTPIVPQSNVLDKMASYTYNASLYLMDEPSYRAMMQSRVKKLNSAQLLISSAGAPMNDRNEYFVDDYYIDKIDLKSFVVGGGTGLSHNVSEVKMTIVEPNGITFLDNLDLAVQTYLGSVDNKVKNFSSQIYLLVIRFYGYDDQGNLIRGGKTSTQGGTSDSNAFVEKWYPLVLKSVRFKAASKLVEYDIEAACVPYQVNAAARYATIPFNIELSAQKIKELLDGNAVAPNNNPATNQKPSNAPKAPPKASAAPTNKNTVRQGLMAALNDFQLKLTQGANPTYEYPDEYSIEFTDNIIAEAKVIPPGAKIPKKNTSMASGGTAADKVNPNKQSMDPNSKNQSVTAGTQIVQALDLIIRNSTYIKEQQLAVVDPATGKETPNGTPAKNIAWFKINMVAEAKLDQYDRKRNDYAYKIKYIISPYKINQLFSPWFPKPTFNGVHKQYNYWFTGQNTSVLSYEENLNALYYIVLSNANLDNLTSNSSEMLKRSFQARSGESSQGSAGRTNEGAASAAEQLYSPGDLKEATVTIIGDPAWLQQGEAFVANTANEWDNNPFLPDGTINFDSQQILFEMVFNRPRDYDLSTGIVDVNTPVKNLIRDQNGSPRKDAKISRVYIAKSVHSEFNRGKFIQTLKGALLIDYEEKELQEIRGTDPRKTIVELKKPQPFDGPRSTVTNPDFANSSSLSKGVQQILNPPSQLDAPTLGQLQASPAYIKARRDGATPAAALEAARAAFGAGTNNATGTALPGIRVPNQGIVKDGSPG